MFDSTTRNRLAAFVSGARRALCGDYNKPGGEITSLLQTYGIQPDGTVADLDSLPGLDQRGYELGHTLRDVLAHKRANAVSLKAWGKYDPHVYDLIQEQAFTVLNRLCALRMAEERDILPCSVVSKGADSDGFQLYEMVADKRHLTRDERYSAFLFSVFDELSLDLGVLFDRFSPHGMLFPRSDALGELLALINDPALAPLWAEDETIGWIYQYWNSKEERKAMRDASAAPRNSRELAVRNQFFTPRYVVEFLTDNTLGRIWYEMTKGQTRIAEQCRYLVRRPSEIFLDEGEDAPDPPEGDTEETLSQEELLKQPVHIPHRPVKDPREIRLLDPACGSMHFGLYAFDLFEAIYEEAWDKGHCPTLKEAYAEKADYLRDVPRLIIEHNIHGVDIDPRAVQIAGLSLWLRAQKTWRDTPAAERPRVRRSNIVCAEPMPGSDAMLEDFVETLDPPLLGELVKTVFDKMQLAGEAGTLLKIEEEIRTAIDDAKAKWEKLGAAERDLFSVTELNKTLRPGIQQELTGIERALITDHRSLGTDFFHTAEERIYAALRDYAESAEAGDYQRRLFAEDAAHGFGFIDLCRRRYDAVVMNPPFGKPTLKTQSYTRREFSTAWTDIYGSFLMRFMEARPQPFVGAITSSLFLYTKPMRGLRAEWVANRSLQSLVELGGGVLDAATVSTALTITSPNEIGLTLFADLTENENKAEDLLKCIKSPDSSTEVTVSDVEKFGLIALQPFCYHMGSMRMSLWERPERLDPTFANVTKGNQTFDDFRFQRLRWEPPSTSLKSHWFGYEEGGDFQPFFSPTTMLYNWREDGQEARAFQIGKYGTDAQVKQSISWWWKPGITYPRVSSIGFGPRLMPTQNIFSGDSISIFPASEETALPLLAFLCSTWAQELIYAFGRYRKIEVRATSNLPISSKALEENKESLSNFAQRGVGLMRSFESLLETSPVFLSPAFGTGLQENLTRGRAAIRKELEVILDDLDAVVKLMLFGDEDLQRVATKRSDLVERYIYRDVNAADDPAKDSLAQAFGAAFGRWDIRYATGERQPPELPDPFDPLPVCPPGMLQNADGLPAAPADVPDDYPLRITWPGILVDDDGHPEDIVARVRDALAVIWGDRSAAIEQEACEILGVPTLRDYFAEKKSGGKFFKDHLKRYSKSKRSAPIYWPLSTESGTYTLWIYYHRLTEDTLYACITNFVAPKQDQAEETLGRLAAKGDARSKAEDKEYEQTAALIGELATFRAELERLAKIWKPNLNDGVQITAAPLWSLFRNKAWQKKLKETWQKLDAGEYDWAHLAHTLWPERVIPKCATDRSLAIAHGYEADLWEEVTADRGKTKWQPRENADEIVARLLSS